MVKVDDIREQARRNITSLGGPAIGDFIREQREQAHVSLRQLSRLAGVSNPYLSQIERGLRRPSADILQQIAKGLRISAEQLYIRAGILETRYGDAELVAVILADEGLAERQKQVLIDIYESFRRENDHAMHSSEPDSAGDPADRDGVAEAAPPRTTVPSSTPVIAVARNRRSATRTKE